VEVEVVVEVVVVLIVVEKDVLKGGVVKGVVVVVVTWPTPRLPVTFGLIPVTTTSPETSNSRTMSRKPLALNLNAS